VKLNGISSYLFVETGSTASHVLQYRHMSNTITIRLPEDTIEWLRETSKNTGVPVGRIVRDELDAARSRRKAQRFMRLAGSFSGPRNLSTRKGYSKR
jgi:hypothetical protein